MADCQRCDNFQKMYLIRERKWLFWCKEDEDRKIPVSDLYSSFLIPRNPTGNCNLYSERLVFLLNGEEEEDGRTAGETDS